MTPDYGTKSSVVKNFRFPCGTICSDDAKARLANNGTQSSEAARHMAKIQKQNWNEAVVSRVEGLLTDMGWDVELLAHALHPDANRSDSRFKTVKHHFERNRSMPAHTIFRIADLLGISTDYLMCRNDDLQGSVEPMGLYDLERRKAAIQHRRN